MKTTGGTGTIRWTATGVFQAAPSPLLATAKGETMLPGRIETCWNSGAPPAWLLNPVQARIEFVGEGGDLQSYLADIGESVPISGQQIRVTLVEMPRVAGINWRAMLDANLEIAIPVRASLILGDSPRTWRASQIIAPGVAPATGTWNAVAPAKARRLRIVPVDNGTFHESAPWALYANSPRSQQAFSWADLVRSYAGEWLELPPGCTGVVGSPTALGAPPTSLDLAVVEWECEL